MQATQEIQRGLVKYPRLRENIWHLSPAAEKAMLVTGQGAFEVPTQEALRFLKMRPYCTGHYSVQEIARRSELPVAEVEEILRSLDEAGLIRPQSEPDPEVTPEEARDTLTRACRIWGQELQLGYIGNEFVEGKLSKTALLGWLIEMYHYIRDFPEAIAHGARFAKGELREVLIRYAAQERGHEGFVLRALMNLGLSRREIETSAPLVSTRTVGFLMRDLFEVEPSAVLMMAALVEAVEFDLDQFEEFENRIVAAYGIQKGALQPLFEHQRIDVEMGHSKLLAENLELVDIRERVKLDRVVYGLHDLKHGFDLQALEIVDYYGASPAGMPSGRTIPRQRMDAGAL